MAANIQQIFHISKSFLFFVFSFFLLTVMVTLKLK